MINATYLVRLILDDILEFHEELPETLVGIRDYKLLESAVNAPFQTFFDEELFKTIEEKAARLLYGIVKNHAFIDGNKRVGVHAAEVFLILNEKRIEYLIDDMERMVMNLADDKIEYEEVLKFIKEHTR